MSNRKLYGTISYQPDTSFNICVQGRKNRKRQVVIDDRPTKKQAKEENPTTSENEKLFELPCDSNLATNCEINSRTNLELELEESKRNERGTSEAEKIASWELVIDEMCEVYFSRFIDIKQQKIKLCLDCAAPVSECKCHLWRSVVDPAEDGFYPLKQEQATDELKQLDLPLYHSESCSADYYQEMNVYDFFGR